MRPVFLLPAAALALLLVLAGGYASTRSGDEPADAAAPAEGQAQDRTAVQKPAPPTPAAPGAVPVPPAGDRSGAGAPFGPASPAEQALAEPMEYLDAVRRQRRALAERRREATRERSDARREEIEERRARTRQEVEAWRWRHDPQGEYLSQLQRQRAQALEAQSEALREQLDQRAEALRGQAERLRGQPEGWMVPPPPFEWGNPWYYRGY